MTSENTNETAMPKDGRTRTWAMIVYPDSAPADWREILADEHTQVLISPLHDSDVNPDGTPKKAHWHVLLMYTGKKSRKHIDGLAAKLCAPRPQPVSDKTGYARYLCHVDNPEKHQYSPGDVTELGGADYLAFLESAADVDSVTGEIMDWLDEQGIYSFAALSRYARHNRPDWFRVITSKRAYYLSQYCKAKQWEMRDAGLLG